MITQERVRELFDYHEDGYLVWKINNGRRTKIGDIAGTSKITKFNRYLVIRIDSKNYLLHRIIFLLHYGYMPENGVDHVDRNRLNNKIENLREVSQQCNSRNRRIQSNNTSGVCGVYFHKLINKWEASIAENGKLVHLGIFINFDDAVLARWKKEVELNWNGCNSTSSAYLYLKDKLKTKQIRSTKWLRKM